MAEYVLGYTREPVDSVLYDPRLAYSLHLALGDGMSYRGLNHNSGVLFALATENEDGSLNPMSLKAPWIFPLKEGGYGVAAVRIPGDGGEDESSKGNVLLWVTEDLLAYRELGLLKLGDSYVERAACGYVPERGCYVLNWKDERGGLYEGELEESCLRGGSGSSKQPESLRLKAGRPLETSDSLLFPPCGTEENAGLSLRDMEGAVLHNAVEVSAETAKRLRCKLLTPENIGASFPDRITAQSREELAQYKVSCFYSDGNREEKAVDWDLSAVDFGKPGTYPIQGRIHQEHFPFPVAYNRADPCVRYWEGKYYFIATNDADGNHTLYVREADTVEGLVEAEEHLILDSRTYEGIGGLLWAPEFHEINGRLYIFHAATPGEFFWEESHIMELRRGGNPACREDWSAPRRIVKKDGSDLCRAGETITLDMTCFQWEGVWYAVWSQRQFLPKDLGAWLYIARLNPERPWELSSEPVILSKPDYGWGNNHTFVEEGPYALPRGEKLYLTFSAAAVDTSYVVSYLVIEKGKDLLDRKNWRKNNYPILTSRSVEGEYGTGHNAYAADEQGNVWNTYHARPGTEGPRSSGIRRVYFDIDGAPVLDVTEELEVKEEYRRVETLLTVKEAPGINPVTRLDYPDVDVIRVEDTYYMVSTTMHFMPGCEILRSYDLRNWEHGAYVYHSLDGTPGQRLEGEQNIYGKGMWAASLRYHRGTFYVCFVANDTHKTYLYTAQDIGGPWEKRFIEGFYHDCSLLFDEDDRVYIAYGNRDIYITELKRDLSGPLEGGLHRLAVSDEGNPNLGYEGAHFYKRNGKYYLFLIHSRRDCWRRTESCFVSDSLTGEFKGGDVLDDDRGYCGQGVAQGGIVDTPDGKWYAMLFQDSGAVGRIPVLVPVHWEQDYPVFGDNGVIPESFETESTRPGYRYRPLTESDDFKGELKPCWQFNHEPDWRLIHHDRERGVWGIKTDKVCRKLTQAKNTITQRMAYPGCAGEVTVDGSGLREGDFAGICALQGCYGFIGLTRREGGLYLTVRRIEPENPSMTPLTGKEPEKEEILIPWEEERVGLRLEADFTEMRDTVSFYYRREAPGASWQKAGPEHRLYFKLDHFAGCRFGLAAYSTKEPGGMAEFSHFAYRRL